MKYSTPEKHGINSSDIQAYIKVLEDANLSMHDIIIARHGEIVFETYWKPFHKDFAHRLYSVTKSFVALAVGFAEQDGLLDLDDPIIKYFPDELKNQTDENMRNQTVRHMLMMSTAKQECYWFADKPADRVQYYFDNPRTESRPSGTIYQYDSSGSFVLGALVERLTGKEFVEYLREKLFDKIGVSDNVSCLKCPGGHAWSDSALICPPQDLLKVAMFCMNKGKWNGEQILNEEFVTAATSKQTDNNPMAIGNHCNQGYGYLIWRCFDNSFFFNGMGCQFAICVPDKDLIFVCNADNQGNDEAKRIIINNFFDLISRRASDAPLPENEAEHKALTNYADTLELYSVKGEKSSEFKEKINGATFVMDKNPMGISKIKVCFDGDKGTLCYTNEQGDKELLFGMCYNEFSKFPQEGYADIVATQKGNRLYDCATSAAWVTDYQLRIRVQIIDTYFGNLGITLGFGEDGKLGVHMVKSAEDFLSEYTGFATGKRV